MVPSRQSCFAFLAAGLLSLCGVLPAHALHAWPSDGVQNFPISTVKTRVGDFSFAASGRLPWRHELSPANTPGSRGCGYETASGRGEWNEHDPNGYSFTGGDPVNHFDADGRCIEGAANYIYSGGSYGQEYRDASTILNAIGDNTSSPTLAGLMGFASYFTDKAANNVTPSYYVNQAASDYNAAGGGVTGVLGVGNRYNPTASAYDFFSGYDLINGQTLSGVDRASAGLNTLGGALLLGAGVADSFQPGAGGGTLNFSQTTASPWFSSQGTFAGSTISDVASQLRAGELTPADVPVQTVTIGGNQLIVNTRSSLALTQAGIPQSAWSLFDATMDQNVVNTVTIRLQNNGLTSAGTPTLRITGSGANASTYIGGGTIPRP